MRILLLILALVLMGATPYAVRVVVRESVTTTKSQLRLEDIAVVDPTGTAEEDVVLALQKIVIGESPNPGTEKQFDGQMILDRMQSAGVDIGQVGYTIPQLITVRRAGRLLGKEEVEQAIQKALPNPNSEIKRIDYKENIYIPIGEVKISASIDDSRHASLNLKSADWELNSNINLVMEEWREVPVAARQIKRGELINSDDVAMARLEVSRLGADFTDSSASVVGKEAQQDIRYGDVFRKGRVKSPPMIAAGEKVVLKYISEALEATASGVAVDSAGQNESIRVRNDSSKRIVIGDVESPGIVIVRAR